MVFILFLAAVIVLRWISRDASFPAVKHLSTQSLPLPVIAVPAESAPLTVSSDLSNLSGALNAWAVDTPAPTTKKTQPAARD